MKRALLVSALAACSADDTTPALDADYPLEAVAAVAAAHHVVGIDTDHAGGLWIAYQMQSAVYTFDDLRIVHLDADGATLSELRYTEPEPQVSGIAVAGGAMWINYGGGLEDQRRLRKLELATGAELASFPIEAGIQDIAVRDNVILLSSTWRELVALDATTGTEHWRVPVTELADSESRGVAATPAGTWVVSLTESRAVLVDDSGATIETAAFPYGADEWSADDGLHLALDGEMLVLHRRNQITWYAR